MTEVVALYVEICVYKFENGSPRYLVLRRSKQEKVYPGIYQMITGTIETGETAIQTALREIQEEIQIPPKNFWSVPFINSYYVHMRDIVNHSPVFLAEVQSDKLPVLSEEHQSYTWHDYESAVRVLTWDSQRRALKIIHDFLTGKDDWGKQTKIKLEH
jgi:dihydroneopterin triphosphate diphosphatase